MKKKWYNCPAVELITLQAEYKICQTQAVSEFGPFNLGGGTDTIDPADT